MLKLSHYRLRWSGAAGVALAMLAAGAVQAHQAVDSRILNQVEKAPPLATEGDGMVLEGLRLFLEEDFGGNGRVCATCHPPTNNFTVDPAFIRTLPHRDPLFVAEFNRALRDLERPRLMRRFGLILENLDGFDQPGVMRSVPHTLGMSQSLEPDDPLVAAGVTQATGWSGDGSPGDGSLLQFAVGAVTQHFPKTLERRACTTSNYHPQDCDFRVPTQAELDALEAFQLFLGRQDEINIEPGSDEPSEILFRDPFVEQGKALFEEAPAFESDGVTIGTRRCDGCHNNAGANNAAGINRQFATGANKHPNAPACRQPGVPGDGGFGTQPEAFEWSTDICDSGDVFSIVYRGTQEMNTPSLIEAADTPPFFHNNIVETIEDSVAFYTTDVFGDSPSGNKRKFILDETEINQIAAMLRVLNALQNLGNGNRFDRIAQRQASVRPQLALLAVKIAISETQDAIEVLRGGPVELYPGTNVLDLLIRARQLERRALRQGDLSLLNEAIQFKKRARRQMIDIIE